MDALESFQDRLGFDNSVTPHFVSPNGAGRHGFAGLFIGAVFGFHACLALFAVILLPGSVGIFQWSVYICFLAFFHASEWYVTAVSRPKELGYQSWLINHSVQYTIAQLVSWAEFWLEYSLFPAWIKSNPTWIKTCVGLCILALGIRITGMITAGKNFDHIVMLQKKDDHQLVTDGIYSWLRHPAYFGWFYWVVCSQMLLSNPVCAVGFAYVSWKFFSDRIPREEKALTDIYGNSYREYCTKTPIGIPAVRCYVNYGGVIPQQVRSHED